MKKFSTLFLAFALLSVAGAAEYARVLNCRIITADKPDTIVKAAADELKLHLSKSYSAPVKLNGKTPKVINFFVGLSKEAEAAGMKAPYTGEFAVIRKGDNFLFIGTDTPKGALDRQTDECGTFHSVAYFVQKYMNVKIFMPGDHGIKYASNPEITFKDTQDSPKPAYSVRGFQSLGKGYTPAETYLYFRRRLGRVPAWTRHNYYYTFLNKWNKRFKDKPEMFALHEGRRVNEKYPRHFPCTSNPAVLDQVEKDIADALKKRPSITGIRFFCDAPMRSCSCDNCRNSPAGKLVTEHDHSETVYAFFCQIANRALKHKQGLYFHVQTKGNVYYQVPKTEKLPPNTVISVLTGHFMLQDFASMRALCDSWRKAGARVLIYSYPRAPEMKDFPLMNVHQIARYHKNFKGAAEGTNIAEGRSKVPYSFSALNTYVHSAMVFDTASDTEKLIDEFCVLAAPKSSAELKSFYTAMEKLLVGAGFRDDPRYNCYSLDRIQAPRAILGKALAKDPGNKFLKQLVSDFDNFMKTVAETGPSVEKYKKAMKEYNDSAAKRKLVKLSEKPVEFPLIPYAVYDDFQETAIQLSQVKDVFRFKAVCKEKDIAHLRAVCTVNHNGVIWVDDVVEAFISGTKSAYPYIHLAVNSKGVYRVQLNTGSTKAVEITDFVVKTKGSVGKDAWSVEVEIPLKSLASLIKDKQLKVGFCRNRANVGKRPGQMSSLQKCLTGGFHSESGRMPVQFQ